MFDLAERVVFFNILWILWPVKFLFCQHQEFVLDIFIAIIDLFDHRTLLEGLDNAFNSCLVIGYISFWMDVGIDGREWLFVEFEFIFTS